MQGECALILFMAKPSSKQSAKANGRIPASVQQAAARGLAAKKAERRGEERRSSTGRGPGERSAFRGIDVFILALLLVLPVAALFPLLAAEARWWAAGIAGVLSLFAFCAMRRDKLCAVNGKWRTPEATLHLFELIGGWPGSYLAQRIYRHKISKTGYQICFWLIVVLYQLVALDYMRGWPWLKALRAAIGF